MRMSISALAAQSGVSARVLRHYDTLGLLTPSEVGSNGYRWYGHAERLRLQRILHLRELGVPLKIIGEILSSHDTEHERQVLIRQRALVVEERDRLTKMLQTFDRTLTEISHGTPVTDTEFFKGMRSARSILRAEVIARYSSAAAQAFEPESLHAGQWDVTQSQAAADRSSRLYLTMRTEMLAGRLPESSVAQALIRKHYDMICETWTPTGEAYLGIADLLGRPGFQRDLVASIHNRLPGWLTAGMRAFANHLS
ncbi:Regulator of the multidrug efflux pump pmrA [Leucobacter sp. 7(1)]|uniref:MerR family transcriptional regulator n=1 Tax=Leucobacter sp. 7(1) TaxID=1255613 RepID=UPI00097E80E5|nr:MerR family transcriptional regulator [Leucobacter sp. 7(1)]SJN13150.1 Regulator of the multidrug efflux pump pmrA [Leucobacter sp. 7(1)]